MDIYPGCVSLEGIFSGLSATNSDWGLVVACDMTILNSGPLAYPNSLRERYDAVVPVLKSRPEPTHALYSKKCVPHIKQRLKPNNLKNLQILPGYPSEVRSERGHSPNRPRLPELL